MKTSHNNWHTVEDKIKFRIPLRRTAVAPIKKRVRRLVKNDHSVRPRYRLNLSCSSYVSLKEEKNRLSNKTFRFFVYRLQRRSFSG